MMILPVTVEFAEPVPGIIINYYYEYKVMKKFKSQVASGSCLFYLTLHFLGHKRVSSSCVLLKLGGLLF